ncbi:MAG TPA: ABC transporter ATP-binding protein [Fibrobacteraceae bacterium]|nr:ABC transporter ATP-binding protein [Fibrobacteraceae bacterium]
MSPLLQVRNLSVRYPVRGGVFSKVRHWVQAVHQVDLEVGTGEIVAVVGESGCGKSTLASALVGLCNWQQGSLVLQDRNLDPHRVSTWKAVRNQVQLVFQDPHGALNPRQTLGEILMGPQRAQGVSFEESRRRAEDALEQVGLGAAAWDKFPHAFSGGQRQRIGIARALALQCRLLICDEPTSALDVSVQAQILQLLQNLRANTGLSILLISHDLAVVRSLVDRVLVMYLGEVVEELSAADLFQNPRHPYTRALLESVPSLDPSKPPHILQGEPPSPTQFPSGCPFATRCPRVRPACQEEKPELLTVPGTLMRVRCPWFADKG